MYEVDESSNGSKGLLEDMETVNACAARIMGVVKVGA
jgi:hypothetical protein